MKTPKLPNAIPKKTLKIRVHKLVKKNNQSLQGLKKIFCQ